MTSTRHTYVLPAVVDRIIDGDSVVLHVGIMPGKELHGQHLRLEGINAPELKQAGGSESRAFLASLLPPGVCVEVVASREDKYGRMLGDIRLNDGRRVVALILAAGFAMPRP